MKRRQALVIGTEVATSGYESGASLRFDTVVTLLEASGFEVTKTSRDSAKGYLTRQWDAIALVSFATSQISRKARKRTGVLWFDSTDSWTLTRLSQIKSGRLIEIIPYLRDLLFIWTAPEFDIISFITNRDAIIEKFWWRFRKKPLIFPVLGLERFICKSNTPRLVFMGDGNYKPNRQALNFLEVTKNRSEINLPIHVYGKDFPEEKSGFIFHGYSNSTDMFQACDIHLAPIFTGAGLKMKVAVPAFNGLTVITTVEGSQGFSKNVSNITVTSTECFTQTVSNHLKEFKPRRTQLARTTIFEEDDSSEIIRLLEK